MHEREEREREEREMGESENQKIGRGLIWAIHFDRSSIIKIEDFLKSSIDQSTINHQFDPNWPSLVVWRSTSLEDPCHDCRYLLSLCTSVIMILESLYRRG